jgi:MoaA/NifB/PqqE/SkfB family radical SAM enzyme
LHLRKGEKQSVILYKIKGLYFWDGYMINALERFKDWTFKQLYYHEIVSQDPLTLSIFTTDRCNFSCFYCSRNIPDDSIDAKYRYEDKSEFRIDDLRFLLEKYPEIKKISFVGIGEPFLIRDLIQMAELAKQSGKRTTVITNGSLLHRHWDQIGVNFDDISISLHGLTSDELLEIANVKEKTFMQFIENIHYLTQVEAKKYPSLHVHASVVVLKNNLIRVQEAAKFCEENGILELDLHNYLSLGPDAQNNVIFDDEKEYIDFVMSLISDFEGRVKINPPIWIKRDERKMSWGCVSFFHYLRVDGLGQVSGCGRIMPPTEENGNFRTEGDVFQNEYFNSMRTAFRSGAGIPECCRYCPDAQ